MIVFPLSACGGESTGSAVPVDEPTTVTQGSVSVPPPAEPAVGATAPSGTSGTTGPPPASAVPAPSPGGAAAESDPGGAGDEEPIRTEASFTVGGDGQLTPASVTVPPFFAVELAVTSKDDATHELKLVGTDVAFTLAAGGRVTRPIEGLQPGMYTLLVDGGEGAGSLVVGDEAGP